MGKIGFCYSLRPTLTQNFEKMSYVPVFGIYLWKCRTTYLIIVHGDTQYPHDVWMFVSILSIAVTNTYFTLTDRINSFEILCICWIITCVLFVMVVLSFLHIEIKLHKNFGRRLFYCSDRLEWKVVTKLYHWKSKKNAQFYGNKQKSG